MRGKPAVLKRADSRIRLFCRRLTGKQRIVLTSVVSLLFTAACLYSVVSSVSRLGERKGDYTTLFRSKSGNGWGCRVTSR